MSPIPLIIIACLYNISLALVDSLFNRLIFKKDRRLPYHSSLKKEIYLLPEWRYIGLIHLIILPVVMPSTLAYILGGFRYVLVYLIICLVIQWDLIFGHVVFDHWLADTPSIALPKIGWLSFPLAATVFIRLILAIALAFVYFYLY